MSLPSKSGGGTCRTMTRGQTQKQEAQHSKTILVDCSRRKQSYPPALPHNHSTLLSWVLATELALGEEAPVAMPPQTNNWTLDDIGIPRGLAIGVLLWTFRRPRQGSFVKNAPLRRSRRSVTSGYASEENFVF